MLYRQHKHKVIELPFKDYLIARLTDALLDIFFPKGNGKAAEWLAGKWHNSVWRKRPRIEYIRGEE